MTQPSTPPRVLSLCVCAIMYRLCVTRYMVPTPHRARHKAEPDTKPVKWLLKRLTLNDTALHTSSCIVTLCMCDHIPAVCDTTWYLHHTELDTKPVIMAVEAAYTE
ncbi:hypothetical protein J6590_084863 [Homalodisca vitripennis]|nr:hypothetical protein J6590_084863 [Homalodisca vitripennis]